MASNVTITITATERGNLIINIRGPVKDKDGVLTLLNEARKIIEQSRIDDDGNVQTS